MVGQQTHVLLVDDEPAICKALAIALTRAGFRASTALSGDIAMEMIRREHVDVLVVDLRIPDMRGDTFFELASAIQPHLRNRTLFTTGDTVARFGLSDWGTFQDGFIEVQVWDRSSLLAKRP